MAVQITGREVLWGISTDGIALGAALVAGIIESVEIDVGGDAETIKDEDGDIVSRIDSGTMHTGTINIIATTTAGTPATSPTLPEKGDIITGGGMIGGVDLDTGVTVVESAKVTHAGKATTKVAISFENYPGMTIPTP